MTNHANRACLRADHDEEDAHNAPQSGERRERLLRLPEVMDRVGLKRTAIYQRMRDGRFPKSRSLGPRCTVWLESDIDRWILGVDEQ